MECYIHSEYRDACRRHSVACTRPYMVAHLPHGKHLIFLCVCVCVYIHIYMQSNPNTALLYIPQPFHCDQESSGKETPYVISKEILQ